MKTYVVLEFSIQKAIIEKLRRTHTKAPTLSFCNKNAPGGVGRDFPVNG